MLLNLGIGLGGLLAATVVRWPHPSTFEWLYRADALTYLTYLVVLLLTLPGVGVGPAPTRRMAAPTPRAAGTATLVRDRTLIRVAGLGLVLLSCGYGAVEVGLPVLVTIVDGLSVSWVGVVYAVNTMTIVAMQLVTLRIIRNRSRSRLMALVGVLWAVSWLVTGLSGLMSQTARDHRDLHRGRRSSRSGRRCGRPIAPALINDLAPEHLRGRYNSVQSLVWGVSGVLGPGPDRPAPRSRPHRAVDRDRRGRLPVRRVPRPAAARAPVPGTGRPAPRRARRWNNDRMTDSALALQLRSDIQRSGYYPDLVADALETALAAEPLCVVRRPPRGDLRSRRAASARDGPRAHSDPAHRRSHRRASRSTRPTTGPTPPRRPRRSASSASTRSWSPASSAIRPPTSRAARRPRSS